MKVRLALLASLLVASTAAAQDISGTWTGVVSVTGTDTPVVWTFKAEGAKLTGGVSQDGGAVMPLKDGKIDGKKLSFTLPVQMQDQALTVNYKGELSDSGIKLTGEASGQTFEYWVRKKPADITGT